MKITKTRSRPKFLFGSILSLTLMLAKDAAWAIPDASFGNPLSNIGVDLKDLGLVLADHDNQKTVYVGPKGKISSVGRYQSLGASINCLELQSMRRATYRFPNNDELDSVISSNRSFSPAFDYLVGIDAHNTSILLQILQKKSEMTKLQEDNEEIYGKYTASLELLQRLSAEQGELNKAKQTAYDEYASGLTVISPALTEAERQAQAAALYTIYRDKVVSITKQLSKINPQLQVAQEEVYKATQKWAPIRDRLNLIATTEASLSATVNSLKAFAQNNFRQNQEVIASLEEKIVGKASAGFNLFTYEMSDATQALARRQTELDVQISQKQKELSQLASDEKNKERKASLSDAILSLQSQLRQSQVQFSQLPVFNVQFNTGVTVATENVSSSLSPRLNYSAVTYRIPSNTLVDSTTKATYASSFFKDLDQKQPVEILMAGLSQNDASSASFDTFVTLGARCGYPKVVEKEIHYKDAKGEDVKTLALTHVYEDPSPNQAVFVQNVSVRYNYYAKAQPLKGTCEIDIDKMEKYWRSAGYSSSWSLFGGSSSTSWDDTRRNLTQTMGMTCRISNNPTGANPEEARAQATAFEMGIYNDMFNMFLMSYAKSYTIADTKPNVNSAELHPLATAGTGIMNLCGTTNTYCAISNIVLKTMDEMAGAKHSGGTSSENHEWGKIYKDFEKDDFYVSNGSSQIEMRVCIDSNQCQ